MFLQPLLLMTALLSSPLEPNPGAAPSAEQVQKAVERSLVFLDKSGHEWMDGKTQVGMVNGHPVLVKPAKANYCASCHHVPMTFWCQTEARNHGFTVDEKSLNEFREWSLDTYVKDPQLKPVGQDKFGGGHISLNTIYLSFAASADPSPDEATRDALKKFAAHVIEKQEPDGSWQAGRTGYEPPIGDSTEVLTMQAVLVLATANDKGLAEARWSQSRDRALAWLAKSKPDDSNQSLALRVLVAQRFGNPDDVHALTRQLVDQQNADGGWSQVKDRSSDAMATGQSLYVLALAGAASEHKAAVGHAQAFLIKTQLADGSWWILSREKGRKSVASSHYGSGWATLGLIRTIPSIPPGLQTRVGQHVKLEGRFKGPGKLADYVAAAGEAIYLTGTPDLGSSQIAYGATVTVEGTLGYRSYPPSTQPADQNPIAAKPARAPDHYFIEAAKVRLLRPRE